MATHEVLKSHHVEQHGCETFPPSQKVLSYSTALGEIKSGLLKP